VSTVVSLVQIGRRRRVFCMKNDMGFSSLLEHNLQKFVVTKGVSNKMAEINENTQFALADLTVFIVVNGRYPNVLELLLSCRRMFSMCDSYYCVNAY
jgi:hypothetical protein